MDIDTASLKQYIAIIIAVAILDTAWISTNSTMYGNMYGRVQGSPMRINIWGAAISYLAVFLLFVLVVLPRLNQTEGTLWDCIREGGIVGLLVYAVYNATNLATFSQYSWRVALMDTLWGGILFTTVSFILTRRIFFSN